MINRYVFMTKIIVRRCLKITESVQNVSLSSITKHITKIAWMRWSNVGLWFVGWLMVGFGFLTLGLRGTDKQNYIGPTQIANFGPM